MPETDRKLTSVVVFLSLGTVPMTAIGGTHGGWTVFLIPLHTGGLYVVLDLLLGKNHNNADPETPEDDLFWYKLITVVWVPVQFVILLAMLWYVPQAANLNWAEKLMLFFGQGVMPGTIGIIYAHELMHQNDKLERWLAGAMAG